jgi:hypothetical protein
MAGSLTNFAAKKLLDHLFGNAAYTAPATLHFSLHTTAPTEAGGGTEVAGGSYARVAVTNNATNFPAAGGTTLATKANTNPIEWPVATAGWGTVVGVGIYDAASAGNMLAYLDVTSNAITTGQTVRFAASGLSFTHD